MTRLTISPDQADDLRNGWVKVPMQNHSVLDLETLHNEERPHFDWLHAAEPRLTRNAARCLACDTVIESVYRHNYRTCGCPNGTMVDGGLDYQRWGAVDVSQVESLCEYEHPTVEFVTVPDGQPGEPEMSRMKKGWTITRGRILRVVEVVDRTDQREGTPALVEAVSDGFIYWPDGVDDHKEVGYITVPADTKPGDWLAQVEVET